MPWQTTIYQREKLYQEVWAEPVRDVARRYGLSDVGLSKICQKLGVPVPGRGFWARKAAGETVKQEPLLPLRRGEVAEHRVERWKDPLDDVPIGPEAEQLLAEEEQPGMRVEVQQPDLAKLHPRIRRYAALLRKSSKKKEPVPLRLLQACLAIAATGEALERALRIADALLRAFDRRGFPVDVTQPERPAGREYIRRREIRPSTTGVEILESRIEFEILELHDTIKIEVDAAKPR